VAVTTPDTALAHALADADAALAALIDAAREHDGDRAGEGLAGFLGAVVLASDDAGADAKERVTLATVHAAKGLEWRAIRVIGLEDGGFPHARALRDGRLEEERRLAYVAMTRAREHLVLSWAGRRRGHLQRPSPFLHESRVVRRRAARSGPCRTPIVAPVHRTSR